nr:3-methyladenine DNA glycosylase [Tessaracoccus sp. OS52]
MLPLREWQRRAASHEREVSALLADVIHRRERGQKHPVDDFLWHYYNLRPGQLRQWHPGIGVELADGEAHGRPAFDASAFLAKRASTVKTAHGLLSAAQAAAPRFGCFGMHEWAMVYQLDDGETRHPYLPLRFSRAETARIVEEVGCKCSHYDAFRFFTPAARPLNLLQPSRESQAELDQPGCLHVNMDLYKWAGKLHPATSSELLLETFLLARDIREVDMRASAYDLSEWGYEPVKVETPEGRAQYASLQRAFAERAAPIRRRLLAVVEQLLAS